MMNQLLLLTRNFMIKPVSETPLEESDSRFHNLRKKNLCKVRKSYFITPSIVVTPTHRCVISVTNDWDRYQ